MVMVKASHTMANGNRLERLSDQSAVATELTLTSTSSSAGKNAPRAWRLRTVHVTYTGAFTGSVTIKIVSALGTEYDEVLGPLSFTAETEQVLRPNDTMLYNADDQIEVVAPLLAAQTSQIEVKRELI
jgi:hypothetical protein